MWHVRDAPNPMLPRRYRAALLAFLGVGAVLALTTLPVVLPAGSEQETTFGCLFCGSRGVADALLNVALYVPVGIAMGMAGVRLTTALLLGALLSSSLELLQLVIPGRDASVGDVITNALGAGLGAVWWARRWAIMSPRGPARRSAFAVAAATIPLSVALTAWLLAPSLPTGLDYWGQWTPNQAHIEWYRGRVTGATIGGVAAPSRRLADPDSVRARLLRVAAIEVTAIAGPPTSRLSAIFSVYDGRRRELLLIGPDRDDLVVRYRTRSTALRLDQPDLRWRDAFGGVAEGDSIDIRLGMDGSGNPCLHLNGEYTCGLRPPPGRAWSVFAYSLGKVGGVVPVLDAIWWVILLFPAALWRRSSRDTLLLALAALLGVGVVPPAAGLGAAGWTEWIGALVGVALGTAVATRVRSTRAPN